VSLFLCHIERSRDISNYFREYLPLNTRPRVIVSRHRRLEIPRLPWNDKKGDEVNRPSFQLREKRRLTVPFLRQSASALLPLFHDEFIQRRIDGQGIIPVKTSEAKRIGGPPGGLDHSFDVEIAETIDIEVLADFFHRHLVSDQLFRIGKIDPVMAGETMRRTTHSQMHLFRACFSQVDDARSR